MLKKSKIVGNFISCYDGGEFKLYHMMEDYKMVQSFVRLDQIKIIRGARGDENSCSFLAGNPEKHYSCSINELDLVDAINLALKTNGKEASDAIKGSQCD